MRSTMKRARISIGPAAPKGTIIVIGRAGKPSALTTLDTAGSATALVTSCTNRRRQRSIAISSSLSFQSPRQRPRRQVKPQATSIRSAEQDYMVSDQGGLDLNEQPLGQKRNDFGVLDQDRIRCKSRYNRA